VILDDRSLNGVLVNGERVGEASLRHGDAIQLGEVTLRFLHVV
jgi:pSer/pThr/pTyr-binding forkhead associated (FHA) protein